MTTDAVAPRQVATVWTTPAGIPERLVWEGRRFVVAGQPIPWIDRISWWEAPSRAPAGQASGLVEQPMWQVQAKAADNGQLLIFDLAVSEGPHWPVTGIYD